MVAVVAAGDRHTARAGLAILDAGGNAVDAAVGASFAAFAAEPLLASAGGAGMLVCALPSGESAVVDFFSPVPGLGGAPEELDFTDVEIDFGPATQTFHVGRGSAAPPLALPGLIEAASRFGRLRLETLVEPAVTLAREGVLLSREGASVYQLLWPIQELSGEAKRLAGGRAPREGTRLANPDLASLLLETARAGAPPGRWRDALLDCAGIERGGLLSPEDLERAAPRVVEPRSIEQGDWTVLTSPRVGGARVATILDALAVRPDGANAVDDAVAIARASRRGHDAGDLDGRGSTTHISVVDADGAMASVTLTNGEGCGHVAAGTGTQINNFLGEEDLNPAGFHAHAPGDALPTMIAPTIALRRGRPALALGSGGSNRIRSVVAQTLDAVMRGLPLRAAVEKPRIHAESDDVWIELEGLAHPPAVVSALKQEFARVHPFPHRAFFFGGVHAVAIEAGEATGVADARRGGATARGR